MSAMTNEEFFAFLRRAGNTDQSVEMSKDGIFLKALGETHEISFAQAEALFETQFGHSGKPSP